MAKQRDLYILVGLPASGKSTWVRDFVKRNPDTVVISSDKQIDALAHQYGITHDRAHELFFDKISTERLIRDFSDAAARAVPIIIDRTNVTKKARRRFPRVKHYRRYAVVFEIPEKEREFRLAERAIREGKSVSWKSDELFQSAYAEPTLDEDFDEVIRVTGV